MAKRVSSIYGNALFELAVEEKKMDALLSEVQTLQQILLENADLLSLLNHPEVSKIEKLDLLKNIFSGRASDEVLGFLSIIVEKDRQKDIPKIFEYFVDKAKEYKGIGKVKVVSATEKISQTSEGILLESLLEGMAEYYSAELAEKVTRGLTENALKCKYNGGTLPIGYTTDENQFYIIDPLTAPAVLDAFKHYAEGSTMQEITNELNLKGIRTKKNTPITLNTVTRMLHNRKYIGEYRYSNFVTPNGMPAIVPKDLFERVQDMMKANKKAPAKHKAEDEYILTTKLFCGKCKCLMAGESGTSRTGIVHRYYKCVSVKYHRGCGKKTVRKEWIEDFVISHIMKIIFDDDLMDKLADALLKHLNQENTTLPILEKQFAEAQKNIDNMLNAIQQGIIKNGNNGT